MRKAPRPVVSASPGCPRRLAIRAFTAGRDELEFQNTMGLFLNCLPFRTDIAGCASFRDIVLATRDTFIDAVAHELPVHHRWHRELDAHDRVDVVGVPDQPVVEKELA